MQVQHWMGHADHRTTSRYLHYRRQTDEARLLADAFAVSSDPAPNVVGVPLVRADL